MENVIDWLDAKSRTSRIGTLVALAVVPLVLLAAATLLARPAVPLLGAVAGGAWFVAAYGCWATVLSPQRRDSVDLKARYGLRQRRGGVGVALVVWIIVLLLVGPALPEAAMGTLNVFVLVSLFWLWRATPVEAAEALAAWQAAQAAAEAEDAGLDPGNPAAQ